MVCRDGEGRRTAVFTHDSDPTAGIDTLLATAGLPIDAPDIVATHAFALRLSNTVEARLWCSSAWAGSLAELEMALDLGAAASPAHWLERLEDRLLDACTADPGPYAALACWCGPTDGEASR